MPSKQRIAAYALFLSSVLAFKLAGAGAAIAADAPGCKDPADLKRFEGASLVLCESRDFGEYQLPEGRLISWDYGRNKPVFAVKRDLEGRPTYNIYFVPKGPSSAEVFRNYQVELLDKGFKPLFEANGAEFGPDQGRIFEHIGPGGQLFGYSPENSRFVAAVRDEGQRQTYVALYVIEFQGGVHPKLRAERGQVLVRLDTIEVGQLRSRMELVKADEMESRIAITGRITIYGIQFDFNRAELKPESKPALDEIATYLRQNPERRLHVVGHTDAVGGFDFNVKLSQARAVAVVESLVRSYGIASTRLTGNGVGMLAPIAPNATEEGRAKNRRVELVPQ